jgi:hypothetical protein
VRAPKESKIDKSSIWSAMRLYNTRFTWDFQQHKLTGRCESIGGGGTSKKEEKDCGELHFDNILISIRDKRFVRTIKQRVMDLRRLVGEDKEHTYACVL